MPRALLFALLVTVSAAADPPVHLGSDRFRQTSPASALACSPDGSRLATAEIDSVHLWDAADGRRVRTIPIEAHGVRELCFSADGKVLFAVTQAKDAKYLCRLDPA